MSVAVLEPESLWRLYEMASKEEQHFLDVHQSRVAFFAGILSTVLTATVVGFFQAKELYQLAGLLAGPILIIALARLATAGTERFYRRFLEAVTVKAKLEHRLGLGQPPTGDGGKWWTCEPLVVGRHLKSRDLAQSADDFVDQNLDGGYHVIIKKFFTLFERVGIVAVGVVLIRGVFLWMSLPK